MISIKTETYLTIQTCWCFEKGYLLACREVLVLSLCPFFTLPGIYSLTLYQGVYFFFNRVKVIFNYCSLKLTCEGQLWKG